VTFRAIFHLWSDLWNDFGTPLEKYSCTCGKRVQNLKKHPFAPIYTSTGANGTPRLSVSQRTIVRAFTGHFKPFLCSLGANIQNFLQSGVRLLQSATQAEENSFKTFLCQRFFHLSLYLWKHLRILFSTKDNYSTLGAFSSYICSLQVLWQKDFLPCILGEEF
jgi:hypothetical protein